MEISFKGKRALVTGGSRGIGRGIVTALAKGGAEVIALGTSQADLDSLTKEVPGVITRNVDLLNWEATREIVQGVGQVDLLVNNAGVSRLSPFLDTKPEDFDFQMSVNVKAVLNVSQVIARGMLDSGRGGAIVNVSSIASSLALKDHTGYCSTKGALDMMTKVMALELGPKIRVNSVNPTVVMTDMGRYAWSDPKKSRPVLDRIPLGRFVEVEEVVNSVLFLLSDQASMLNGVHLPVDGGLHTN